MKKMTALFLALILCLSAVSALADVYSDAGFIKKIPMKPKYTEERENRGAVEKITYTCHSYAEEEENPGTEKIVEKDLYVYLPYGYDENGTERYNVIYFLHGTNETQDSFIGDEKAKNALDARCWTI